MSPKPAAGSAIVKSDPATYDAVIPCRVMPVGIPPVTSLHATPATINTARVPFPMHLM
jgi:hypothetical protein